MKRNGYKKLLANVRMNTMWLDEKGEWNKPTSSNNQLRMNKKVSAVNGPIRPNAREWIPANCYLDEQDLKDVYESQGSVCYWYKMPLDFNLLFNNYQGYFPKHPLAPSVDRKDDAGDYTVDNIVISSRFANYGRNVYPFEEFHEVINHTLKHGIVFTKDNMVSHTTRTKRTTLEEFM